MKSKKIYFTNLILLLLALTMSVSLFACSSDTDGSSVASTDDSDSSKILSTDVAKELVEKDKKIIEIFACNSLCPTATKAEYVSLPNDHELRDFNKIRELISSTYSSDSNSVNFLMSYPLESVPSVREVDGVTNVFHQLKTITRWI